MVLFEANRPLQRLEAEDLTDLVVDISKSTDRAPWCIGATPCVLPNSRLHWRRQQRVLDVRCFSARHVASRPSSHGGSQRGGRGC